MVNKREKTILRGRSERGEFDICPNSKRLRFSKNLLMYFNFIFHLE